MTEGRLPVGVTGKYLDTRIVTQGDGVEAHREVVIDGSIESTSNTTTSTLAGSATYTGTWEQNDYTDVMVSCYVEGGDGTLYFDFSVNGTDTRTFPSNGFKVTAGIHEFHTALKGPRYFRVRYVDGSSDQTTMQLYTYFGSFRQGNSPLNQTVSLDTDAAHVRPSDFQDEVRIGRRTGIDGWNKFGYRTGLTAANGEETVWATTGNFTPLTSASTFTIAYDGTGGGSTDGTGTTGATELTFYYVDASGLPAIATHTLGTDGSDATSFTGLGINRIAVSATGTADKNNSAITVTATTGGTTQAIVPAGGSVTQQAIFFVGSNHDAVAKFLWINVASANKTATVLVKGYVYNRTVDTIFEVFRTKVDTAAELTQQINEPIGFNLSPTDVLYFVADTDTTGVDVVIRFSLNQYQRT